MRKRIAQIGTFDVENFGDLLFTNVLDCYLGKDFDIDLYSPIGGKKPFENLDVLKLDTLKDNISKYSAIIIGGGDLLRIDNGIIITNEFYGTSCEPSLQLWIYPIILAKQNNIPIIFNAVGVPNDFNIKDSKVLQYIVSKVDYLCVRDIESKNALEKIGINNIIMVPDSVFSIKKVYPVDLLNKTYSSLVKEKIVPNIDDYIIFQHNTRNISDTNCFNKLVSLLKKVSKSHPVFLMPIGYIHDDDVVLKSLYDKYSDNVYLLDKRKLSPLEMLSIIYKSYGYIGTSMHGAITSTAYGKKIMIINYMNSKKLHGVANLINKRELDVNNVEVFDYIYDNYFEKQEIVDLEEIINKIDDHFNEIKNLINSTKHNSDNIDVIDFVRHLFSDSFEYYGYYYHESNAIEKKYLKYVRKDDYFVSTIDERVENITIFPIVNGMYKINELYINDDLINIPDKVKYNYSFNYNVISDKLNIKIKFTSMDIEDVCNEYESNLNTVINEYKDLERKYCSLINNEKK